jgi:hypothetical protein
MEHMAAVRDERFTIRDVAGKVLETPRAGAVQPVQPILSLSALSPRAADLLSGFVRLLGVGGYSVCLSWINQRAYSRLLDDERLYYPSE